MKQIDRTIYTILLAVLVLTAPQFASAKIKEYIRDYEYQATGYDSEYTSRISAIDGLKSSVLEEIGTYISDVISINKDSLGNAYISKDTTQITAGIISLSVLDEDWNQVIYYIKGKLTADDEEVLRLVKQLSKDQKLEQALRDSMDELSSLRDEIKSLKQRLDTLGNESSTESKGLTDNYLQAVKQVDFEMQFQKAILAYIDGYFGEMILTLTRLANSGYPKAMSRLGYTYEKGLGVRINYQSARQWYDKAIANGSKRALARLGFLYERGLGVTKDPGKAIELYNKAIAAGNSFALARLGQMYLQGEYVQRNYKKAFSMFEEAARHNNGRAFTELGEMYEKGLYIDLDLEKAADYYQKGADKGNPQAMAKLGHMYHVGKGVDSDLLKAYQLIKAGADRGNAYAIARLGQLYEQGDGLPHSDDEAFKYYKQSAQLGSTLGYFMMGRAYDDGIGVEENEDMAIKWYQKAVARGHEKAKRKLSRLQ